jgi:hypothetical protein
MRDSGDFQAMLKWFTKSVLFAMARETESSTLIEKVILELAGLVEDKTELLDQCN